MNLKFTKPASAAALLDERTEHTDSNIFAAIQQMTMPVMATRKRDGVRGHSISR